MEWDRQAVLIAMAAMQLISTLLVFVVALFAISYMQNTIENRGVWQSDRNFSIWLQCESAKRLNLELPEVHPCGNP